MSTLSESVKLDRDKTRIHTKMEKAWDELSSAVSAFHALEEHYDLSEQTIELVDGWTYRIEKSLYDAEYLVRELGDWAFDGDSHTLMEDAE
jgi:hypothetical protein